MQLRKKLMLLELIAGLFGWVWIFASLAFLYFLAVAVFGHGTWSKAFWTFGIAAVAKWLARGFGDNKKRIAFEAHLVSQGHTPDDAAREWTEHYTTGKT